MGAIPTKTVSTSDRLRQTLDTAVRVSSRIFQGIWRRDVVITLALVFVLVGSAMAVAYTAHLNRALYSSLSQLQLERDAYQRQWTQLLLEQSALSAHSHVEQKAGAGLDMRVPEREDIVVVQLNGR